MPVNALSMPKLNKQLDYDEVSDFPRLGNSGVGFTREEKDRYLAERRILCEYSYQFRRKNS
jgi:hypothetical protein